MTSTRILILHTNTTEYRTAFSCLAYSSNFLQGVIQLTSIGLLNNFKF